MVGNLQHRGHGLRAEPTSFVLLDDASDEADKPEDVVALACVVVEPLAREYRIAINVDHVPVLGIESAITLTRTPPSRNELEAHSAPNSESSRTSSQCEYGPRSHHKESGD